MVKREIKKFELNIGDNSYNGSVPCSVKSVLASAGASCDDLGSSVSFEAVISADETALSIKYFYLRVRGIKRPCEIYLGKEKLCSCNGITPIYNVDLSGKLALGDNRLSVRFFASDGDLSLAAISESFEIIRFGGAMIDDISITQTHSDGKVTLGINLDLLGDTGSVRAVATLVSPVGQIYYAGLTSGSGSIVIPDPLYWWPAGLGVQNIYRLTVNLYGDSEIEDSVDREIGLRDFKTEDGNSFFIGGVNVIPMGAVYISDSDVDTTKVDRRIESHIKAASKSGYNCLVIPLESPTPSDKFYQLCDSYGIMVIEEHSELDDAAIDSLHARAHHPSLCLVDVISGENIRVYDEKITERLGGLKTVSRVSQYEYISSPALPSMKSIRALIPEGERSLFSRSVEALDDGGLIREMLMLVADRYPYPHDLSGFGYASALASAHRVGEVIKESRLTKAKSGRGIFDRFGDLTLKISPSAIDHRGRWKPLQYYCARFFAPVTVYADKSGGEVKFSASNHRRHDFVGSLEYRIADASNYTIFKASEAVEIPAMTEREIHTANILEIISGHESEYYLEYYLKEGSASLSKSTMLFLPEKHFDFKKPTVKTEITGQGREFSITLSSKCFVKDLEIGFDGIDAVFSDNYIDITGETPIKIDFTLSGADETARHLEEVLEIRSVWDLK